MTKPPTVHDVARLSGVSTATVSRYFGGKADAIAPQTLEKVKKAAETLGYTPSEIGRSLRLAQSRVVVMMVPDATNHFTADVASSVEKALKEVGLSMVLANASEDAEQQDRLLVDALGLRARAIVLQGAIDTPRLREICARQNNVIFVNRRPADGIIAPYVGVDNYAAGLAVGKHFLERGYQNCVALHGPKSYSGSTERLEGFIAGLGKSGKVEQLEGNYTMESGYERGRALLTSSRAKQSIFCGNDMIAYGVHRAAMELKLRVPEDLILMGFDDNRLNEWLAPWLSTVTVPAADFGPAITRLIIHPPAATTANLDILVPFAIKYRSSA
ncbi:LacI family DNA-binding transcriptional regulator [Agrobacterium sp. SOY23]|uniref:LacI family DNA-binding transcriptional regulator n=1 Tax=Agrobacterium sp. SOY23 TaxID=3014555 RepID=UPI0022AF4C64|nr:LacI family DNA-binding transcriptional regulator [Agrobacterium sp. SOY23]MCZ4433235.1 LacI family DNA-binding transcriptional regulator [Agrobacterium sp. SOY23]